MMFLVVCALLSAGVSIAGERGKDIGSGISTQTVTQVGREIVQPCEKGERQCKREIRVTHIRSGHEVFVFNEKTEGLLRRLGSDSVDITESGSADLREVMYSKVVLFCQVKGVTEHQLQEVCIASRKHALGARAELLEKALMRSRISVR